VTELFPNKPCNWY